MTLIQLLEAAFDAGRRFEESIEGGTIDHIYHDNGQDFVWWLENNLEIVLNAKNEIIIEYKNTNY